MGSATFLTTARLVLRAFRADDIDVLVAYRNDPEVARYQDWELPYTRARAEQLVDGMAPATWPNLGASLQIAVDREGELVGDLYVGWSEDGGRVTIGYTFATAHQGKGYAVEAVDAVIDRLMSEGVQRFDASIDPANLASMRVLERVGFVPEGRLAGAVRIRGEWVDDMIFGMTSTSRRTWVERPRTRPDLVELVEITTDTSHLYRNAVTHMSQERLVSPTTKSYEHTLFPEPDDGGGVLVPWMRGIHADGEAVGFVMMAEATPTLPDPYLWRLAIGRLHQSRGIGSEVIRLLVERVRAEGHRRLVTSWVPGRGSPEPFYLRLGFVPTGKVVDDEVEGALEL